jgi:hypothetical protein
VGQRHCRDVAAAPKFEAPDPNTASSTLALADPQRRSRTVDQQSAQVTIPALADAEHGGAATGGAMAWDQSQVRRQFASAFELSRITHCGHQCGRDQGTDPFDLRQSTAALVLAEESLDAQFVLSQAILDEFEALADLAQDLTHDAAQSVVCIFQEAR